MQWEQESHDRLKIAIPLGGTTLTLAWPIDGGVEHKTLSAREIGIVPARQTHQIRLSEPGELVLILLEPGFVVEATQGLMLGPDWNLRDLYIREDRVIQFIGRTLCASLSCKAASERAEIATLYRKTLLRLLAIHLVAQYARHDLRAATAPRGPAHARLAPILAYVCDHLEEDLKVAALAKMAQLSLPHFCRLFKRTMGLSPYRYILLQRISLAKTLLDESALSLSDIALQCGFYDQSHFNLQFRNHTGATPQGYRDRL